MRLIWNLLVLAMLPVFVAAALLPGRRTRFVWGSSPLINNKYWSEAIREGGRDSVTMMGGYYASINRREDFDLYFQDFAPARLPRTLRMGIGTCLGFLYVLRRARVLHTSFEGFALGRSALWRLEAPLLKLAGIRTIVLPYGADFFVYSRVDDTSTRHALLASYPAYARNDAFYGRRLTYWSRSPAS